MEELINVGADNTNPAEDHFVDVVSELGGKFKEAAWLRACFGTMR
jgi:hypothetical protein